MRSRKRCLDQVVLQHRDRVTQQLIGAPDLNCLKQRRKKAEGRGQRSPKVSFLRFEVAANPAYKISTQFGQYEGWTL